MNQVNKWSTSSSPSDVIETYNKDRHGSLTLYEAKRTLEAINNVRKHPKLNEFLRKENEKV